MLPMHAALLLASLLVLLACHSVPVLAQQQSELRGWQQHAGMLGLCLLHELVCARSVCNAHIAAVRY